MKLRSILAGMAAAIIAAGLAAGCGGGSNAANAVTVSVGSSVGTVIIVGQSTTLTATVTGGTTTNTAVNWQPCQFTTTTVSGTTPTTSTPATCPSDGSLGALSNQQTTGTATYTAPGKVPDQTKFPGLQIVITAQSQQDTTKTGSIKLILDSGIGLSLTPSTATVATSEPQGFTVTLTNDLQNLGVTWLLTQSTATTTITEPNLATCSPGCGSITNSTATTMTYTAPATVPTASTPAGASTTPADVTIVATAKADNTRFVTGTISIIQGGPITFNGISPTIAPQGGVLWDIYLDAPNITSASKITITSPNVVGGGSHTFSSSDVLNQVKVLVPVPNAATTTPPGSTGARLRLLEADLGAPSSSGTPVTYTVSVSDPGQPVTQGAGPFTFTLMPVRPTLVASSPHGVIQGSPTAVPVVLDGGYFGPGGTFATASSTAVPTNPIGTDPSSNARRLVLNFPVSSSAPGLYPVSVTRNGSPLPTPNNSAVTTISVFPNYASGAPAPLPSAVPAGTNPSAIDIDPNLGVAVVAETSSNAVQFYTIGVGSLTPLGPPVGVGTTPTGVSVNPNTHCVAVANYGSQSVSIVPIPNSSCPFTSVTNIDLSGALQGQVSPAPRPFAIGVDQDTNLALVAYSSTSTISGANLGFVVNLNQGAGAFGCLASQSIQTPPCIFSQVSLNTGQYPQVAMDPHAHRAYVTPGGSGVVAGIDVTQPSTSIALSSFAYNAGTVTATTANSTPLTGLVPGIPTTVLISGVPPLANSSNSTPATLNLNGVFSISVTSSTSFSYFLGTGFTGTATSNGPGTVFFGEPNLIFGGLSNTTQGIAINPISHTAALADANATGQQISILNQLDESFASISFQTGCTAFTVPCTTSGEIPGTGRVAWQPYTNSIVSYNPGTPATPVNEVSISDPVTLKRYGLVNMPQGTAGSATISVQNGTTNSLTLLGGIAVDAANNQAFVVQSGSGLIQIVPLTPSSNPQKPTEISEVVVSSGGIPNALVPQAALTPTTASATATVQIFGTGFVSGAQVLLDGVPLPSANVVFDLTNPRLLTATIPNALLSMPHHYALQVASNGFTSNPMDFIVVKAVDMNTACSPGPASPISVAIADQVKNQQVNGQVFSPIAVVTNSGCSTISMIDINPASPTFGTITNPFSATLPSTISVGGTPQGIAISQHLGLAVVANNGAGTVSIVDLVNMKEVVPDVPVGTSPMGVGINEATGVALVANFGSNTVSQINLGLLFGSSPATSLTAATIGGVQSPIAIAIDPDRGTNNQGLAEVTGLQTTSSGQVGALYPVDIGLATPTLSTVVSIGSVTSTPSGIVFNPAVLAGAAPASPTGVPPIVTTGTSSSGLFYVNSSGSNVISSFNPDTGQPVQTQVGINPTALAINPQSGAILTSNFGGKSASVVDTVSNPKTVQTLGFPGSAQFGVAIDQFTNLAVIVDSANNRVLLFPMPN
jgi:DNA-binding beta-propeller fold protein YncE